jgi:hypothetical protein
MINESMLAHREDLDMSFELQQDLGSNKARDNAVIYGGYLTRRK